MGYRIYIFLSSILNEVLLIVAGLMLILNASDGLFWCGALLLATGVLRLLQYLVQLSHYIPSEALDPALLLNRAGDGHHEQQGTKN